MRNFSSSCSIALWNSLVHYPYTSLSNKQSKIQRELAKKSENGDLVVLKSSTSQIKKTPPFKTQIIWLALNNTL